MVRGIIAESSIKDKLSMVSKPKLIEALDAIMECKKKDKKNRTFSCVVQLLCAVIEGKGKRRVAKAKEG